jgi:hypothetical protein
VNKFTQLGQKEEKEKEGKATPEADIASQPHALLGPPARRKGVTEDSERKQEPYPE